MGQFLTLACDCRIPSQMTEKLGVLQLPYISPVFWSWKELSNCLCIWAVIWMLLHPQSCSAQSTLKLPAVPKFPGWLSVSVCGLQHLYRMKLCLAECYSYTQKQQFSIYLHHDHQYHPVTQWAMDPRSHRNTME